MMNGVQAQATSETPDVKVYTTSNRGFTPEELTERALDKLIEVSDTADEMVKAQALVYKERIRQLILFYMKEAIRSDRTTLSAMLVKQGHSDMARIISKL
jgi:hypothetical protein